MSYTRSQSKASLNGYYWPSPECVLKVGFFFLLAALFQIEATISLVKSWASDDYGHGPFIVLISVLWSYSLLRKNQPAICPSVWGLWLVFFAILLRFFGDITANNGSAHYSIIIMISGLVAALAGLRTLSILAVPLCYLIFAIPLPPTVTALLTAKMQLLSSTLGVVLLNAFSIPVFQEGNIIDLGNVKLQVAEACSGLRFLFPLLSLGFLVAYLFERNTAQRLIVFFSTIPIAIAMNALRIVVIGLGLSWWGENLAEGTAHDIAGWIFLLLCIAALAGIVRFLSWIWPEKTERSFPAGTLSRGPLFSGALKLSQQYAVMLMAIFFLAFSGQFYLSQTTETTANRSMFSSFPLQIGDWAGHTQSLSPAELDSLKLDDYLNVTYHPASSPAVVNFYVAYYASQRRGSAPHSPTICIPGAGWEIVEDRTDYPLQLGNSKERFLINRVLIKKGAETQIVYFWIQAHGRILSNAWKTKAFLLWDSIHFRRSDTALVRFSTPVNQGEDMASADQRLSDFIHIALPILPTYVGAK